MLEDGMKIAEAIRKLDFISIGPLGEAEQELFEHLLVVSEEIMQAMRRTDDMSAVTAAELVEDFKADLLTIRSKMVEVSCLLSLCTRLRRCHLPDGTG